MDTTQVDEFARHLCALAIDSLDPVIAARVAKMAIERGLDVGHVFGIVARGSIVHYDVLEIPVTGAWNEVKALMETGYSYCDASAEVFLKRAGEGMIEC